MMKEADIATDHIITRKKRWAHSMCAGRAAKRRPAARRGGRRARRRHRRPGVARRLRCPGAA
eukprot:8072733-Pyramimonas_sp.AAC.1